MTARRPWRIFNLPFLYLIRAALRIPGLLPAFMQILPNNSAVRVTIGNSLFRQDHPQEALEYFTQIQDIGSISTDEYLVRGLCLYQGLGRFRDAVALWAKANELAFDKAKDLGLDNGRFRVLDNAWARHIGDSAMLDYVIKLGILEGRPDETILYLPPGSQVANRFLFDQVTRYIRVIEDPADLPFDPKAVQALHYDMLGPRQRDGRTSFFWEIAAKTYERWHRSGKGALLTLPADVEQRGWEALESAGMRRGDWFVALHVREHRRSRWHTDIHDIRNADIKAYLPAINEVTRRGGWVIRMGDPSMTPLPALPRVIDYCHRDLRADWMDIFIAARCRFMLGSGSGPVFIPPIYGVPSVITNWWPPAQRPLHAFDIFVPKMPRRLADGGYLTLSEMLREPVSYCQSRRFLTRDEGVVVEDADPEIIRAAAVEMLARLDGSLPHSADVADLRARADRIYEEHGVFGMSPLAGDFIQHHCDLIV
jgi:putative glycosyltransferase (TIGR04372 family)